MLQQLLILRQVARIVKSEIGEERLAYCDNIKYEFNK
jgi:hypothetical protein